MSADGTVPVPLGPGGILALSGSYWKSLALHAAVKLDLFDAIGGDRLSGADTADRIGGDRRGISTLLDALAAMGLVEKHDGTFSNTADGLSFLVSSSPRYLGHLIRHHANLVASWNLLDESAKPGRPVRERASTAGARAVESFLLGMHTSAMGFAPRAVPEIDLAGRRRLLDLGGGPGTWSVQFALFHQDLEATVFDLPGTKPYAEETISRFGVAGRVKFHGGDFLEDDFPGGHDAAWLSHILHGEDPAGCRKILRKTATSLGPGGLVMVHEFILDDDMTGPLFPVLFSLNMLTGTSGGRSYSRSQLEEMLAESGISDISLLPLRGPTDSRILAGFVKGD